jgi:hypothetical protein
LSLPVKNKLLKKTFPALPPAVEIHNIIILQCCGINGTKIINMNISAPKAPDQKTSEKENPCSQYNYYYFLSPQTQKTVSSFSAVSRYAILRYYAD